MSELAISGKQPDEIKLGNKPEYSEADRNIYRDKWRATQGIRGALRNLARQVWR